MYANDVAKILKEMVLMDIINGEDTREIKISLNVLSTKIEEVFQTVREIEDKNNFNRPKFKGYNRNRRNTKDLTQRFE